MPADYWDSGARKYGHYEEDEEEWSPPVVRDGGRALSPEDAMRELARQAEERERLEQERLDAELARTLRIPAGGYMSGVTEMRRLVAADKKRIEEQRAREEGSSVTGEEGRSGA